MTATETMKPIDKETVSKEERMKRLIEIAERDSLRRDFEIVRERHGLQKTKTPK